MGDLLSFPIDIKTTIKHLRQDMRDDWFYDAVRYEDLLTRSENLEEILSRNLDINHGIYESGGKTVCDVPKSSLGLRYSLETDFYDRFLYQGICSYLIEFFDPLLSHRLLSHRYNKFGDKKYLFKHRIELWNTFENISHVALQDGKTLLVTDLLNYFEQISIASVESAFINLLSEIDASGSEKNTIRSAISTLTTLLERWCYNDRHGLPQNRDASSFIANVVLNAVDKKMVSKGYDYFRYVDDIRILCNDEFEAKRALNDLIYELRELGLNINSKKTDILTKDSPNLIEFFPSTDENMTLIDNMWRSRSKKVIAKSVPILFSFLKEQIESNSTQSRPFRYCINRFKTLISSNLFDSKSILATEIGDTLIGELAKQPVSTDQFCKLLMDLELTSKQLNQIAEFISDQQIAIHEWQNYHLLFLMAHKKHHHAALIKHCQHMVSGHPSDASVPACFIYLASIGEEKILEGFIENFIEEWPYQHQRYFLIALQTADKNKLEPLYGKVGYRLKGTVKRLQENKIFKGQTTYLRQFNASTISNIYDEISPYE